MKTAGVVAEYNPFHNGHAYHLAQTRRNGATHIAAVMSGCFTQRGEPSVMGKRARCEAALRCGADLIVELPLPWAIASAETFAFGAVSVLNALGCIDTLSFGSECGSACALDETARLLTRADGSPELKNALAGGASFPRARFEALSRLAPQADLSLLKSPNDTLAVEYIRALGNLGSKIQPVAVLRMHAAHDAGSTAGEYASASHIRLLIANGRQEEAFSLVPAAAAEIYRREFAQGLAPFSVKRAEPMILSQLRRLKADDLRKLPDVTEGLENRILSAVSVATGLDGLLSLIKSKRYTLARVRRIVWASFLGVTKEYTLSPPPYIRVLGFNERGAEILREAKATASLPIVTRHADFERLGGAAKKVYALECLAADLYGLCLPIRQPCGSEQKYGTLFINS